MQMVTTYIHRRGRDWEGSKDPDPPKMFKL